ncbi:MAG: oligoendopeptidase F [Candidatus Nanohaloarchaea archaeon]
MSVKEREDISEEYKWDLEKIYENQDGWETDFENAKKEVKRLQKMEQEFETAEELLDTLKQYEKTMRVAGKVFQYAHMRSDEDKRKSKYQELESRAKSLLSDARQASSFLEPAIQGLTEEEIDSMMQGEEELERYRHYIEDIMRSKPHTRSGEIENILADLGEVLGSSETYSRLSNADLKFPEVETPEGEKVELTQSNFTKFLKNRDRDFRKEVYEKYYDRIGEFSNTFSSTLENTVKTHAKMAGIRKFDSARKNALHGPNIPVSVYDNLVETVEENVDLLHRLTDLKRKALGVDEMHMWDIYVPTAGSEEPEISFEEAKEHVIEAVAPLGEEYQERMKEGIESGWIDVYENRGKRSGAYSSGSYDTDPYILMNYQDDINSMFTLAHELGHSMHSEYSEENQPYVYSDYSIFVAEVASTMNEALLTHHLLENVEDEDFRRHVLSHYLEGFRGTLFRQAMFADFEHEIHREVEKGGALTAEKMSEMYREKKELYYSNAVVDDRIATEWMRIPHFYYNYYVYQYATGISAATALSAKVLKEGKPATEDYLEFLSSGSSDYPVEVLKKAGVDMTTVKPIERALDEFREHLDEMEALL